jgi:hypothetical protein
MKTPILKPRIFGSILLILTLFTFSCKKENTGVSSGNTPTGYQLTYGDSVFYINGGNSDYTVQPLQPKAGRYIGFPEGIDIDSQTGAIRVNSSETGLRYRVTFYPDDATDSFSTNIVISGINYLDGFYRLNTADSVLRPVYNGNFEAPVPGLNSGTIFDEGSGCNTAGCNVNTIAGTINLAQTVRNGVFGINPSNNDRHEFELVYRINDKSGKALNNIKVKLYYFNSINDVTQEVYDIISSRDGTIFGASPIAVPFAHYTSVNGITQVNNKAKASGKPRPPCIFILGR